MQIRFVILSLRLSPALCCRCCRGAAVLDDSNPGDPHCLPADDQPDLAKPGQTHKHETGPRPPITAAIFPSVRMTFTCIKNHKTPCETDQENRSEARQTEEPTSRQMEGQQTGRRSHSNTQAQEKLHMTVHISPPHSSWHCFISSGLWRTQLSEAYRPRRTDSQNLTPHTHSGYVWPGVAWKP